MNTYSIKLSFRNLTKNKFFSTINILGLSVGLTAFILITNYASFELSFDKFHSKQERIYRVESQFYDGDLLTDDWGTSSFGYGSAISSEMTGIDDFVRIGVQNTEQTVSYKGIKNRESGIAFSNHSFFNVFDFKLTNGDINTQLTRPNTVVITKDIAYRYFKDKNPLGEVLTFASGSNFYDCEVTGVMDNFPENSHIKFNYLISYETLDNWTKETWYLHEAYTYLLLSPEKNPKEVEQEFPQMAEKYKTNEALKQKKWAVSLVPLKNIHLNPQKQYERETKGNKKSVITLIIIAFAIMFTGWINYINLTTARSMERAKDIGVRKVSGAKQHQIIRQYLLESGLINLFSIALAVLFVIVLKPLFNRLVGINLGFYLFSEPLFWVSTLSIIILGIVVSGYYPALIMSKIKPSVILKGNFTNSKSAGFSRKALVVFQFAASIFLICGTFIVYQQIQYMQKQSLGVNIDQTIVLKYPVSRNNVNEQVKMFAKDTETPSFISSVTVAGAVPGMEVASFASNRLQSDEQGKHKLYEMLTVDHHFVNTFDFELLAGRSYRNNTENEMDNILINEAALGALGFSSPKESLHKQVILEGSSKPVSIIGVVKDWHQRGLRNAHTPIMFILNGRINWVRPKFIAIKTASNNYDEVVGFLKKQWLSYFPEASFNYFFLNSFFDNQYKADQRFGRTVGIFTSLTLFISILGLWALTTFNVSKKVKEVGVRKVLGANTTHIITLFSKETIQLIVIALLIATPLSIVSMKNWLINFAFHTDISYWVYLIGGGINIFIALLTVAWLSWKAVIKNPVEALRYE